MPRVYRTKNQYEGFLIREFLTAAGYRVRRAKWTESPDAQVIVSRGSQTKSVGIEHTRYFNDTVSGTVSSLSPISDFWERVQDSLVRRISHRRHLTGLDVRVKLNGGFLNATSKSSHIALARQLAAELVALTENHPIEMLKTYQWRKADFQRATLQSAVTWLTVSRYSEPLGFVSRCDWTCSNISCGNIGLSTSYILSALQAKNGKVPRYRQNHTGEIWLLITAGGENLSNHAGSIEVSGPLSERYFVSQCQNSPFDRIVFWERIRNWYKWLKPSKAACSVQ